MFNKYFPDFYFNKVEDIPVKWLIDNNIKGIILDMDNTLINSFNKCSPFSILWLMKLKKHGITPIILSNYFFRKRVKKIANVFRISYIFNAKKPNTDCFDRALKILKLKKENVAIVGDQIFTDIRGGKKFGITTILVKPLSLIEIPPILIKRLFEIPIIISYKLSKKPR